MALTRPRYSDIVDTDYKASVRVVTTTPIVLSGGAPSSYDSVSFNRGDRVLVTAQTNPAQNGIYVVTNAGGGGQSAVLTRSSDFDGAPGSEIPSAFTFVEQGSISGNIYYFIPGGEPNVQIGTTAITFTQFSGAGSYLAGTGLTLTGNTFSITNTGVSAVTLSP